MNEKDLDKINLGKIAEAIWPDFLPMLVKKKADALAKLKDAYTREQTDTSVYIAQVAVMAAIDEIISDIERRIRVARETERKILDGRE